MFSIAKPFSSKAIWASLISIALVACGGSGSSSGSITTPEVPATTTELSVKPALGGFSGGANVGVYNAGNGQLLGSALTGDGTGGSSLGVAKVAVPITFTGVATVKVTGGPGVK